MTVEESPIHSLVRRLVEGHGPRVARLALKLALDKLTVTELAAFNRDWASVWARPKQLPPADDNFKTWGLLAGRSFGKTLAGSHHVNRKAQAHPGLLIGLAAQNEATCIDIQVLGPSGLIATSPLWCPAEWHAGLGQVHWRNGSRAYVRTPESPGNIRGVDFHLSWLIELQSWPTVTGPEALMNFFATTRLGRSQIIWDATGKSRHPLLKELLAAHEANPQLHQIVRGAMYENTALSQAYLDDFVRKYPPGTQRYREEVLGELLPESESALIRQSWIDANRAPMPASFVRRVIGIDPAVSGKGKGRDRTGIVHTGQTPDGRIYVIRDDSAKFDFSAQWVDLVIDAFLRDGSDIAVETNKGGELVSGMIRMGAERRGLQVEVVEEKPAYRTPGVIYVKEVFAYGDKADRAAPLAMAYERGQVSHVIGADLSRLEDTLCTYEPGVKGQPSPDDLDALVHATTDMLPLAERAPDPAAAIRGAKMINDALGLSKEQRRFTTNQAISISDQIRGALGGRGSDTIGGRRGGGWGSGKL